MNAMVKEAMGTSSFVGGRDSRRWLSHAQKGEVGPAEGSRSCRLIVEGAVSICLQRGEMPHGPIFGRRVFGRLHLLAEKLAAPVHQPTLPLGQLHNLDLCAIWLSQHSPGRSPLPSLGFRCHSRVPCMILAPTAMLEVGLDDTSPSPSAFVR